ncbi:MAG: sulfite exporter TauE/SafE family protein [Ktedonobacteraceae bacterium]|nr:sulfite exporter TauE/SafE family protein [Ktedonobacteraceae bacterium]
MSLPSMVLLFFAAVLGGTLNSVAGGGSFFTFPSLIFAGVPAIPANATSTVALWPGSIASVGAYRRELVAQNRLLLFLLVGTSLIGGVLGAILLLRTPATLFVTLLPYLLLMATLLFTFSGPVTKRLHVRSIEKSVLSVPSLIGITIAQFIIAIYGGYFGGGIGILMLATLTLMGMEDIHMMNGMKTLLTSCINGVAVITFVLAGAVVWLPALVMVVGAIIGGYGGAYYARKIEQKWIRIFVMVVGFSLTLYFFIRR